MRRKRVKIYAWKNEYNNSLPIISDFSPRDYNPKENASNVARLIMEHLPGNTNDILFQAIENEIKSVLRLENGKDLLLTDFDIGNRIRASLDKLIEKGQNKMKEHKPNDIVKIYQDPITKKDYEGQAKLLSLYRPDVGDGREIWKVKFLDDGYITTRTIYKKG